MKITCCCGFLSFLICQAGAAGEPNKTPEPAVIVSESIAAIGDRRRLVELEKVFVKGDACIRGTRGVIESWFESPRSYKSVAQFSVMGKPIHLTVVVSGNQGWTKIDSETKVLSKEELDEESESYSHRNLVRRLYPLLEANQYRLSYRGQKDIDGCSAHCVRVSRNNTELDLYFDLEDKLLKKTSSKPGAGDAKGKLIEQFFSDYKDFDGIKCAAKTVTKINGELFMEDSILELRRVKEFPKDTFSMP